MKAIMVDQINPLLDVPYQEMTGFTRFKAKHTFWEQLEEAWDRILGRYKWGDFEPDNKGNGGSTESTKGGICVIVDGVDYYWAHTEEYEGWFDSNGKPTASKNDFMSNVNLALALINLTEDGSALLQELSTSNNRFVISEDLTDGFIPDNLSAAYSQELKNGITRGSGGKIGWNTLGPAAMIWTLSKNGKFSNRSPGNRMMHLAHELFHARDANRGLMSDRKVDGLPKREWQAVYKENTVRQQFGLPIRTHYGEEDDGQQIFRPRLPRLLKSGSNIPIRPSWMPADW